MEIIYFGKSCFLMCHSVKLFVLETKIAVQNDKEAWEILLNI